MSSEPQALDERIKSDVLSSGTYLVNKTVKYTMSYMYKSFIFVFIFALFVINLFALTISLQCNRSQSVFFKVGAALFAFMFGILYIIMNYYMYRIRMNNDACVICRNNIFGLR